MNEGQLCDHNSTALLLTVLNASKNGDVKKKECIVERQKLECNPGAQSAMYQDERGFCSLLFLSCRFSLALRGLIFQRN